jgi:hypothetical protein
MSVENGKFRSQRKKFEDNIKVGVGKIISTVNGV